MDIMTLTESVNQKPLLRDFLDASKIPYILCQIDIVDGKKKPRGCTIPRKWTEWDYEKCKEYNKKSDPKCKCMNINLKKGNLVVIDIDDPEYLEKNKEVFGDFNMTLSMNRKLPHLWRSKVDDDPNTTKVGINGADFLYNNVFELIDSECFFWEENAVENKLDIFPYDDVLPIVNKQAKEHREHHRIIDNANEDIVELIDDKYRKNYEDWLKIIWAIKYSFENYEEVALRFSNVEGYDNEEARQSVITHLERCYTNSHTFGTICYYAIQSNKEEYLRRREKYKIKVPATDLEKSEIILSKLEGSIYRDEDNVMLFNEEKKIWEVDRKPYNKVNIKVTDILVPYYIELAEKLNLILSKMDPELKEFQWTKENYITATANLKQVRNATGISNVKNVLLPRIPYYGKEMKFDQMKKNYFVFRNKAFDFETRKEIEVKKEDLITLYADYDYKEPTDQEKKELDDLLNSIFPDPEVRDSYLSILRISCTANRIEKFILANGDGRNGKGVLNELMACVLGNHYFYMANPSTICQPIKDGANPSLASLHKKRMVIFSEPSDDSINIETIKAITGNDVLNARGLYCQNTDCYLNLTGIIECNKMPRVKGRIDNAIINRIINVRFPNYFTDEESEIDDKRIFRQNPYFKSNEFKEKYKYAMFHKLLNFEKDNVYVPSVVKKETTKYLEDKDVFLTWFLGKYKITENKSDVVTLKDMYFKFRQSDFYKNCSKVSKRTEWTKKGFVLKVTENQKLNILFREKIGNLGNHLIKVVELQDEDDNFEDDF